MASVAIHGDPRPRTGDQFGSPLRSKQSSNYELLVPAASARRRFNRFVLACALLASLNSSLLGYDIGVMSGAVLFIKEDLHISQLQEEILIGSLNLVSLVGGIIAGRLSDAIGRRKTMAIASLVFFTGALVMGSASTFTILLAGRLIAGIGVGFGLMIAPVYTAELSPASTRGALVSLPEIFINFGILQGYVASYALSGLPSTINWRLMLALGATPAIALALGVTFMPESPRWLVTQNRLSEAAAVLIKTSEDKAEADLRLADIIAAAEGQKSPKSVWRELLCPSASVRRMLLVALGVHFFQQASGIDALVYYSPAVFHEAGVSSNAALLGATVAVGVAKTSFILIATLLLDRLGRRPLLLISTSGMTVSLAALASGFLFLNVKSSPGKDSLPVGVDHTVTVAAVLALVAICSFVSFFSIGMGPVCWVLTSEIFPLRLRAQAMSLGIVVNRLASSTVAMTFLSVSDSITPAGTFFMFAAISAVSVVFTLCIIPETKGKTLEEIVGFFANEADKYPALEMKEAPYKDAVDANQGEADDAKLLEGNIDDDHLPSLNGLTKLKDGSSRKQLLDKVKLIAKQRPTA